MRGLTAVKLAGEVALAPARVLAGMARDELAMRRRRVPVLWEPPVFAWFACVGDEVAAFLARRR